MGRAFILWFAGRLDEPIFTRKSAFEILGNDVFEMPDTNVVCAGAFVGAVLSIHELFSDKPKFN